MCGRKSRLKILPRASAMAAPCGDSSSMPLTAGISLSPPIPIERLTLIQSTLTPCSLNAVTHASACASLLSTSVPSTSKRTALSTLIRERRDAGLSPPENQRMDIMGAFVGIDDLEIDEMADHAEFVDDAVAAEHVASIARDRQRLAARIAFQHRGDLGRGRALVLHAPEPQHRLQTD